MLKAPHATLYAINPETGLYELGPGTTQALMDVMEELRPEWLTEDGFPSAASGGHEEE